MSYLLALLLGALLIANNDSLFRTLASSFGSGSLYFAAMSPGHRVETEIIVIPYSVCATRNTEQC